MLLLRWASLYGDPENNNYIRSIPMSVNVEKLEGNMAKLTIELPPAELDRAITKAYEKIKNQIQIPGFRKGKVPQKLVEKTYGVEVFYEDAADYLVTESYRIEAKRADVEIVSSPQIEVEQIEKGKPFIYTAVVAIKPEVTLGEYKGLEYTEFTIEVSDEEIEKEIEKVREQNSRMIPVEDRPAAEGDTVELDFDGYVEGKQFDGGKCENYSLELGSHSFIGDFEEQIEGHNAGDEFEVNVTFPEEYGAKELAGKPAVFKCRLNEIKTKELPEVDDEFAAEVSEFDTLEEYKEDVKKNLADKKTEDAKNNAINELIEKAVENAEMDIPDVMVLEQAKVGAQNMAMNLQQYGMEMDQYLQMLGMTYDQFVISQKPSALKLIQSRLILGAIAKAEGLEATEEDITEQFEQMAEVYNMSVEKVREVYIGDEYEDLKEDIAVNKASNLLFECGVAAPAPAAEEKEEETEDVNEEPEEKDE